MAAALFGWLLLLAALVTSLLHVAYLAVYDRFLTVTELVEVIGSLHPKIAEHGPQMTEWYLQLPQTDSYYAATKLAPMVLLCLYSVLRCGWAHTLGLMASAVGDYALVWPEDMKMFKAGTAAFGIAHVFFILSVGFRPIKPLLLLPFLAVAAGQFYNLNHGLPPEILSHTGLVQRNSFLPQALVPLVGAYSLVFALHGWRAVARLADTKSFGALLYLLGVVSFMVSDAILSTHHFIAPIKFFQVPVIISYFGGQWLMTAGAPSPDAKLGVKVKRD